MLMHENQGVWMVIKILPEEVASQIAAGEVVERPASVVKELIENALDAEASLIAIVIEEAGKRLIEIMDDGSGIPADELSIAVARHATSKLSSAEDLQHIDTLGFRGEALAAIGSVSRLTITSRTELETTSGRIQVDSGKASPVQTVSGSPGTVVQVEDLFFNVPARLKFLKSDRTERKHIRDLVIRYALANPTVRFHLKIDGRELFHTSGMGDAREVLTILYGAGHAKQFLPVDSEFEGVGVRAFISPPNLTRANRREITFFVNRRPVQDVAMTTAFTQAYHTLLMVGRFPMGVIFLEISPEEVDVNVHPTKAEVRFRERDRIFRAIRQTVRRTLLAYSPIPQIDESLRWRSEQESFVPHGDRHFALETTDVESIDELQSVDHLSKDKDYGLTQKRMGPDDVPLLRWVGQVGATYIVAEGPDGLYLIDQHAAHERVLFERLMAQSRANHSSDHPPGLPSQSLLEPVIVEMMPSQAQILAEQIPVLQQFGFDVELFGRDTYRVRSVPNLLMGMDPANALMVLVEDFEEDETPLADQVEAKIIARVCKRAAVKAGQVLTAEEGRALLRDLEACVSPRTCPHGRPTMIHLSVDLLERQFGRRGAR